MQPFLIEEVKMWIFLVKDVANWVQKILVLVNSYINKILLIFIDYLKSINLLGLGISGLWGIFDLNNRSGMTDCTPWEAISGNLVSANIVSIKFAKVIWKINNYFLLIF